MLDRPWNVGDVIQNPQDWHEEKGFRLVQKKGET